jgi:glycosyltransferase involved in cell wall biosynthesis
MDPKIALVVATYNRARQITKLLESLERQSLARDQWEVMICDDGSSDETPTALESCRQRLNYTLRIITQKNQGQCVARDQAIRSTKAAYIVIVDDDMEVKPDFLQAYFEAFADRRKRVIIGRVYPRDDWKKYPMYEAMREHDMNESHCALAAGTLQPTGTYFITQNVGFSREFYLEVGGFDAKLKLAEDCELGWRFEKNSAEFIFSNAASAVHHSNIGSYHKWMQRQYDYGKYCVYIWEKYGREIHLHPLRNFVTGHPLYPALFRSLMWSPSLLRLAPVLLRMLGETLKRMGLYTLGLYAYRAQQNIQYHRGVLDQWDGKPELFLREVEVFCADPKRPIRPLGDGPVFLD